MRRRRTIEEARPVLRAALRSLADPDDALTISEAISGALGVDADVGVGNGRGAEPNTRVLELHDPGRPRREVRILFPNRYDMPSADELRPFVEEVEVRLATLRSTEERRRERRRARRRGALAEKLVGVTDVAAIAGHLTKAAVPRIAKTCQLLRSGDDEDGIELRVPDHGWPAIGYGRLADDRPETAALARDLAQLTVRAATIAIDVDGKLQARQVLAHSLLPQAVLPGARVTVASRYRPAGGTTELAGGDFYDVLHREDDTVLIVGDVQGKGVEAAALTSVARHTLRAGALRGLSPASMLSLLNHVLLYGFEEQCSAGEMPERRFMTAVVAHLRPAAQGLRLTLARAGHPPPIVLRRDGDAELLQPAGALLGVRAGTACEHAETDLGLGDTLLLYTDGVTEQRPHGESFDEHDLAHLVRSRRDITDVDGLAQLVLDTVLLVTRSHERDDIA
ncbi:MAG: PP2C family protein-serine/threonine phosphatase, partial [Acidimicrobiales bacterium]